MKKEKNIVKAHIKSREGEFGVVEIVKQNGNNDIQAIYQDKLCTGMINSINGEYYIDDEYGIIGIYRVTARERVQFRVDDEFYEYKKGMIEKEPMEIFSKSSEIHAYTEIKECLLDGDMDFIEDAEYECLIRPDNIIQEMYQYYLDNETASVSSYDQTKELITNFNDRYNRYVEISVKNSQVVANNNGSIMIQMPSESKYKDYCFYVEEIGVYEIDEEATTFELNTYNKVTLKGIDKPISLSTKELQAELNLTISKDCIEL